MTIRHLNANESIHPWGNGTSYLTPHPHKDQIMQITIVNNYLLTYVSPVVLFPGLICNAVLVAVLLFPRFRNISVFLYLRLVFMANFFTIVCDGSVEWLCLITRSKYIANRSDTSCRVWIFLLYTIIHLPSWLIVGLAIDRYIAIWHFRKAVEYCTVFVAKIISALVIIGVMAVAIHALWTFELRKDGCYIPVKVDDYHVLIWSWISTTVIKLLPCIAVGLLLIAIVAGFCLGRLPSPNSADDLNVSMTEAAHITIAVCAQFFVFTVPMNVYDLVEYRELAAMQRFVLYRVKMRLAGTIFKLLVHLVHSHIGLTVLLVSASARKQIVEMLKMVFYRRVDYHRNTRPVQTELLACRNANFEEDSGKHITIETTEL